MTFLNIMKSFWIYIMMEPAVVFDATFILLIIDQILVLVATILLNLLTFSNNKDIDIKVENIFLVIP